MNAPFRPNSEKQKVIAWTLVAVWAVFIFAASATSGYDFEMGSGPFALLRRWLVDVLSSAMGHPVDPSPIGHFTEYFVFGALLMNALRMHVRPSRAAWGAIAIVAAYAVTDEFHQLFVPGRACDPADWLVDVSAAAIAALVYVLVCALVAKRRLQF
ncbi:MAG: VanZ family protein, partial [Eggerthellaceae bacterium]|nr:VanZ family protein [Eggerthellaceae bacterium]